YTRLQRSIGRQRLQTGRLIARVAVILALVGPLVGLVTAHHLQSLAALGGGLLLGALLASISLRLTRFESTAEGIFYTPNLAIGLAISLLLIGRIAYRMTTLVLAPSGPTKPSSGIFQTPLTSLILGLMAAYYVAYAVGILVHGRKQTASLTP